jgi:hypothetical protein
VNDDVTPDPFGEQLSARLHEAADRIDGPDVDRTAVAAAVERTRRRQARNRSLAVGAAAVIALLGGLAVATRSGTSGSERVQAGSPTTVVDPTCATGSEAVPTDGIAWFRLSAAQAQDLLDGGAITAAEAAARAEHAVVLTNADLRLLGDHEPTGEQLFQAGSIDSRVIDLLRADGALADAQELTFAGGAYPRLDQAQVDRAMAQFPDLAAITVGGGPLTTKVGTSDGEQTVVAGTAPMTVPDQNGGTSPFQTWVTVLRDQGLLSAAQETEAAAGRGFTLTAEQSAALQAYWDQQAADVTTTDLAFAPGPEPATTAVTPCPDPEASTTTAAPAATTTTSTTAPPIATSTTAAGTATTMSNAPGQQGTWIVYLYILSGRRNADGTITKAIDRMAEITAGSEPGEMERAQRARDSAGARVVVEANLACDEGAAQALGLDTGLDHLGISVGFAREADAQAFVASLPADLGAYDPVLIADSCTHPRATS